MHYSKLRISSDASSKLRSLRQRTGLTPNLLCRLGLMLSLEEGRLGEVPPPDEDGLEFNAYTLTGEHTGLFGTFLRWVEEEQGQAPALNDEMLIEKLRGHIHRGIGNLSVRAKSPIDLLRLIREAA